MRRFQGCANFQACYMNRSQSSNIIPLDDAVTQIKVDDNVATLPTAENGLLHSHACTESEGSPKVIPTMPLLSLSAPSPPPPLTPQWPFTTTMANLSVHGVSQNNSLPLHGWLITTSHGAQLQSFPLNWVTGHGDRAT
ncbi:hypothetical protein BaRGS_00019828 [Batillaria attramentaria]|uniref:Uncharacterized protein n=1 Tax=Batillaria attramentaria TaxID=370345 RepID=A0ABD0KPM7_9CAEN